MGGASTGWANDRISVDLNVGLEWLPTNNGLDAATALAHLEADPAGNLSVSALHLPDLVIPSFASYQGNSAMLSANGRWQINDHQTLGLGASLSRIQLNSFNPGSNLSFNQAAINLGLSYGALSGGLTGRVIAPNDMATPGNTHWASIDLGVSWRTPWQGELSVGTQNLWSNGTLPGPLDSSTHENDGTQPRVPYVQYHQDL